jgi:hypothetical protein
VPGKAKVAVRATIGPDGSAQTVSAESERAPVARCIEKEVKAWRFPSTGCSQDASFSLVLTPP